MKKYLVAISLIVVLISCEENTKKTDNSAIPVMELANFDNEAFKFVDKEIQIEGLVDHICKHGGKKLELVGESGSLHVLDDSRFDDAIVGEKVLIKGKVFEEFHVDEAYCIKKEEDYMAKKESGELSAERYKKAIEQIEFFRDSMSVAKSDHLSFYALQYTSHEVLEKNDSLEVK